MFTPFLLFLILKYVSLAIRIYIFLNISQVPLCMLSNSQHRGNFSFLFNSFFCLFYNSEFSTLLR
nr:MAG TPA: hypothetical protein [Caudoviricetes sp.]